MAKWQCRQSIMLALVALFASAVPSLAWSCSSEKCGDNDTVEITHERCHDEHCLSPHATCCKPLQLPQPNTPPCNVPHNQQIASSQILPLLDIAVVSNLAAILPRWLHGLDPPLAQRYRDSRAGLLLFTQHQSTPLRGRAPPAS